MGTHSTQTGIAPDLILHRTVRKARCAQSWSVAARGRKFVSALLFSFMGALPCAAWAQSSEPAGFRLDGFSPGMDRESVIGVESANTPLRNAYDAYLWLGYGHNLLMLSRQSGGSSERVGALVGRRVTGRFGAAWVVHKRLQVGVDLPVVFYQGRGTHPGPQEAQLGKLTAAGMGELRFTPKIQLFNFGSGSAALAFLPVITLPTASPRLAYLGDRAVTATPTMALSGGFAGFELATNLGWKWRREHSFYGSAIGPEIVFGAGASIALEDIISLPIDVAVALQGRTASNQPFASYDTTPMELLYEVTAHLSREVHLFAGGAVGLIAGIGTPDFRAFMGVRYSERPTDRDGDSIADAVDSCPDVAEDVDGYEDDDGCPDPHHAELTNERIEISENIHFESGKATIKHRSYELLGSVARLILASERIKKVRIEGYTDNVGGKEFNRQLSHERAEAVRTYLIQRGVEASMLEAKGFGEAKPVAGNASARGRAANRRVEFIIVQTAPDAE